MSRFNSNHMVDRFQEFAAVLGSVRLEGAEPSPEVIALGERWARGELGADDLASAAKQAAAGLPLTDGLARSPNDDA